jgi:cell division protein ZapA (FtsZ GTPase activity inhibitor)
MSELSTTVTIAGRTYPLTIKKEDEEGVREAARLINEKVKEYEDNYSVRDKQDLLAMCALQLATHNVKLEQRSASADRGLEAKLTEMESLVSNYLQERQ